MHLLFFNMLVYFIFRFKNKNDHENLIFYYLSNFKCKYFNMYVIYNYKICTENPTQSAAKLIFKIKFNILVFILPKKKSSAFLISISFLFSFFNIFSESRPYC